MKNCLFILWFILLSSPIAAGNKAPLYFGMSAGYSKYNSLLGEIYLKLDRTILNRDAEVKFGMTRRSYQLTFDKIKDLNASSIGFFGDAAIYPFTNGLFTGIRWEAINFNWLSNDSRKKIEAQRDYSATSLYTGSCAFLQVGYTFNFSREFKIKLYSQSGIQQFRITNGATSSGSYIQTGSSDNIVIENNIMFTYNVNLSIELKIR